MIFNMLTLNMKNLGMIEIVPHWKNWALISTWWDKIRPVSTAQGQLLMWFLDSHSKKYKETNFHENWPYRTQVMTILLDTENWKWWISEKKMAIKLPKFQKLISQEKFWCLVKKFCSLLFLISSNNWAKFDQNLRGWVTKLKILSLFDVELPCYKSWWYVIYPTFYYKLGQNLVETKAENLLNSRNSSIF